MLFFRILLALLRALTQDPSQLLLEILALRHQLLVLHRSVKRPQLKPFDRILWVFLSQVLRNWRPSLILVKPETVVAWHRLAFRAFWRWKSRPSRRGRPTIPLRIINLIRRMARENPLWSPERIQSELALLGHDVAEATVKKYMRRKSGGPDSQTWMTFLRNHLPETAACDFFVVPTVTFRWLVCSVILSHERRRIVHFNVTANPSAEWTAQQIVEAFPGDGALPSSFEIGMESTETGFADVFETWASGRSSRAGNHPGRTPTRSG